LQRTGTSFSGPTKSIVIAWADTKYYVLVGDFVGSLKFSGCSTARKILQTVLYAKLTAKVFSTIYLFCYDFFFKTKYDFFFRTFTMLLPCYTERYNIWNNNITSETMSQWPPMQSA
jgi:hypothetical protein